MLSGRLPSHRPTSRPGYVRRVAADDIRQVLVISARSTIRLAHASVDRPRVSLKVVGTDTDKHACESYPAGVAGTLAGPSLPDHSPSPRRGRSKCRDKFLNGSLGELT